THVLLEGPQTNSLGTGDRLGAPRLLRRVSTTGSLKRGRNSQSRHGCERAAEVPSAPARARRGRRTARVPYSTSSGQSRTMREASPGIVVPELEGPPSVLSKRPAAHYQVGMHTPTNPVDQHRLRAGMVGLGMIFDDTYRPLFEQLHAEGLYRRDFGSVEVEL